MSAFVYPAGVNLNEKIGTPGAQGPRYWGQSQKDGVLFDSLLCRTVSPVRNNEAAAQDEDEVDRTTILRTPCGRAMFARPTPYNGAEVRPYELRAN